MPTRVTATDIETGESETHVIEDNWVIIRDGRAYVASVQTWPKTGTTQLTIKIGDSE